MLQTRSFLAASLMAFALMLLPLGTGHSQELTAEQQETIHEELRVVRDTVLKAMKNRDPDALLAVFTDDLTFTAMNNDVVYGLDGARKYYERMVKSSASIVEDMSFDLESDELSRLYNNGTSSVSAGISNAHFKLRGGLEFTVPLRWTATMTKVSGAWRINSAHFSANMFDNPLTSDLLKYFWWILAGVALIAALIGYFFGRRSKAA